MPQNELIEFLFGSSLVVSKSEDRFIVKGFASTPDLDLEGDIADPAGFSWGDWPKLLVEHAGKPVGNPLTINQAQLVDISSIDNWGVVDVQTGEQIETYPKSKVPTLKSGSLGLFVTAEVTEKSIVEKVKSGELGAFSWRGLATMFQKAMGAVRGFITDIDLREISLVRVPANPQAAFVVCKSLVDLNAIFDDDRIFPSCKEREVSKAQDQEEDANRDLVEIFPSFLK